jgi:hypothetical protein
VIVAVPSGGRRFHARLVKLKAANYCAPLQPRFQPFSYQFQVRVSFMGKS